MKVRGNEGDLEVGISNMRSGKEVKEMYRDRKMLIGKRLRLFFAGHEIEDEEPLYKFKLVDGAVIVVFII